MNSVKIYYFDCKNSGISGDMLLSAVSQIANAGSNEDINFNLVLELINEEFPLSKIKMVEFHKTKRNNLHPVKLTLEFEEKKHHHDVESMKLKIQNIIKKLNLSKEAEIFASKSFEIIIEAEGSVHNTDPKEVHLHEVGSIDTVIDICGITYFLEKSGIFRGINENLIKIYASPISVGGGTVNISHGTVPVPAPATSLILKKYNIPIIGGPVEKELCTPTGAALIAALIEICGLEFSNFIPNLIIEKVLYSTGNLIIEDFSNILVLYQGIQEKKKKFLREENVAVLETTVDDVTGEMIGYIMDLLLDNGALDVNFISTQLKKNRPGSLIKVICEPKEVNKISDLLIKNLGTLGVRYRIERRMCVEREIITRTATIFGEKVTYRVKVAGDMRNSKEVPHFKIEYDDLVSISEQLKKPLSDIKRLLELEYISEKRNRI